MDHGEAMKQSFTIPGRLDGMNEYTAACRSHYKMGWRMKRDNQDLVGRAAVNAHLKPHKGAVVIRYRFFEKANRGKMRDKSNIAGFAVKVIEDALQEVGIIQNDNWKYMAGYSCAFWRVTENPRIEVEIEDV